MNDFDGKIALVTGAARGIGRATAIGFAQRGADVALVDIAAPIPGYPQPLGTLAELEQTAEQVREQGRRALVIQADVRDSAAVDDAVKQTLAGLGGLHIVIANAGLALHAPFIEQDNQTWQLVLDTNLYGAAWVIRAALPQLVEQRYGRASSPSAASAAAKASPA